MLRAVMHELALPVTRGEPAGVCGLRKPMARGELGTEVGVSGLYRAAEWVEAREEGRDGRRVGVKKRKGTPATSSWCLCIKSKTCCSSYNTEDEQKGARAGILRANHVVFYPTSSLQ
jgi:hypothetical protein